MTINLVLKPSIVQRYVFSYSNKQFLIIYITRDNPIFCVFLDASKALDRVNYYLLFQKLIVRNVPMCFVRLLVC